MNKYIDFIIGFESGDDYTEEEAIEFFQAGVSEGWIWGLQGSYGRLAQALIDNEEINA